ARIDRQIREAQEQGLFDDLPGMGKPLAGLDRPHDGMWWVNKLLDREDIRGAPPTLAIRKAREEALERVPTAGSEAEVRDLVDGVNQKIRQINRLAADGPPSTTMPIVVEDAVRSWRAR
ncbi:MAG: DUF1992 domain-containing protein, partial [Acidimicrobiales bacterium]